MALAGEREEVCGSHIVLESHISALAHQEAADLSVVVPRSHVQRCAIFLLHEWSNVARGDAWR